MKYVIKCHDKYLHFRHTGNIEWACGEGDAYCFDNLNIAKKCLGAVHWFFHADAKIYSRTEQAKFAYQEIK